MKQKKVDVLEYNAIFQEEKEGGFSVWIPSLLGCTSQGDTFEEAQKNIKEAIQLYLADEEQVESDDVRRQFIVPVNVFLNA
jgi:predicted RNase H-like HicB family nuclease